MVSTRDTIQEDLITAVRDTLTFEDMTQVELARRVGITPKHLSQLLQGRAVGPIPMWQRIFRELGLTIKVQVVTTVDGVQIYP